MFTRVWPGRPYPLGATWDGIGVNFALFSENATKVELLFVARPHNRGVASRTSSQPINNEFRDVNITSLGEARFPSPLRHAVSDQARIPADIVRDPGAPKRDEVLFELAGPREKLFFDPTQTRAGIVTCGGLCPGLNNVIRALFFELHHTYGVAEVLGFRGGYQGLDPGSSTEPTVLTPAFVDARNAVHAAMAGKTGLVIGFLHDSFIHIPIEMLVLEKKHIDPDGIWWTAVLAATGQPARFE
jgi:hypothetical protein